MMNILLLQKKIFFFIGLVMLSGTVFANSIPPCKSTFGPDTYPVSFTCSLQSPSAPNANIYFSETVDMLCTIKAQASPRSSSIDEQNPPVFRLSYFKGDTLSDGEITAPLQNGEAVLHASDGVVGRQPGSGMIPVLSLAAGSPASPPVIISCKLVNNP